MVDFQRYDCLGEQDRVDTARDAGEKAAMAVKPNYTLGLLQQQVGAAISDAS